MADKCWLIYGTICALGSPTYLYYNGSAWVFKSADYRAHLKAVSEAGANAVRHLPYGGVWWDHPYGKKSQFSPFKLISESAGWDLTQWNEEYFDIIRSAIEIENSLNLTSFRCLADNCEYATVSGNPKKYSPWVSNTHTSPVISSIYDTAAYPHWSAYITKCQSEWAGLDIMWSLGNEMNKSGSLGFRTLVSGTGHTHTDGAIFPLIESGALIPTKMTYGATMMPMTYDLATGLYSETPISQLDWVKADVGNEFGDPAKLDIYKEIHGCGKLLSPLDPLRPYGAQVDQACKWWGNHPIRKVFSDDGTKLLPGNPDASLTDKEPDGAKPSATWWHNMVLYVLSRYPDVSGGRNHLINFEHLPQIATDAVQVPVWTAISTAYYEHFGTWPENYTGGPPTTGSLQVTLLPAGAISAGAQWNVDGGSWQDSAATVSGLAVGNHTIYYKSIAGYTSPATAVATITSGGTTTATGTYVLVTTGGLKVTLAPAGAVTDGAKWWVDGGPHQDSEDTVLGLAAGTHQVGYLTINGWTSPTAEPGTEPVTIEAGVTLEITGTYTAVADTGSLKVTLLPAGAITNGAAWSVDNGAWQDSEDTVTGLSVGNHTVRYRTISGYTSPATETASIVASTLTEITGTYVLDVTVGNIKVTLLPAGAITAGAQWKVDSGAWHDSEVTVYGLLTGGHTIEYKTVTLYDSPPIETTTVVANATTEITGTYTLTATTGDLQITLAPDAAVSLGAKWNVDNGAWQDSAATVTGLSLGSHTVKYLEIVGYTSPATETVTIT